MKRNTAIALGTIIVTGLAIGSIKKTGNTRNMKLHIERKSNLPSDEVINIISQVEKEPGIIPFVESVSIIDKGPCCTRYEVKGSAFGVPWWMRFKKAWDQELGVVKWASECGSYGLRNTGRITITDNENGSSIILDSKYVIHKAVVDRYVEKLMRPGLEYAFRIWLDRLSDRTWLESHGYLAKSTVE
ncbi:MAG: hypothetical protein ACYC27_19375 [Armatimonadota bacterium]